MAVQVAGDDMVRAAEWARVRTFVGDAWERSTTLVVTGEAGAGKSTLWRAGVAVAEAAGRRVLRSEPTAADTGLAFAGLSDLLAAALPEVTTAVPAPQREALEVALLLRPAGSEPPPAHAVGLAVLSVLRALAAAGPVLVAVDDVQWLDGASLEAMSYACRRGAAGTLGLLLAARTEPVELLAGPVPASPAWRELVVAERTETVELAPLGADQIRRVLPFEANVAEAHRLTEQSHGNPFWAREIAAGAAAGDTTVPALARTLADRLTRSLSAAGEEALALVSAAGRITLAGALRLLDHVEDPAAAVDEAVLAGVVTETGGRLAAAHPLIGAAAVQALPPGRRRQLYLRLTASAASLEARAHFAALAAGAEPDEEVAGLLAEAAEAAHGRAGNAEAAAFAAGALRLTPAARGTSTWTRRCLRATELLYLAGDVQAALERAEGVDLGTLTTPDLQRLLILLVDLIDVVRGSAAAAAYVARLVGDTELVGDDPRREALVLVLAADVSYGLPGRQALAARAVRAAESAGPDADALLHRALLDQVVADLIAGDGLDVDLLARADRLETGLQVDLLKESSDLQRGMWARRVEDLDTSRAALQRMTGHARDVGDDVMLVTLLIHLAMTEELAGDYAAARRVLADADDVAAWHDWPPRSWHAEARCDLLVADGDLDAALALADEAMPDAPGTTASARFLGDLLRGRVHAWQGDPEAATVCFERAAAYADEREFVDPGVRRGVDTALAEAYVAQGRLDRARSVADWLHDVGTRLHRPTLTGNADRIRAGAAAVEGDLGAAVELAGRAVAAHEQVPLRLELVRSLLTLGRVERRRRARQSAREALTRARRLAHDLGHRPLTGLVDDELRRVGAARAGSGLTVTEQRVAELVAGGASNREAAAAMFVGVRTVETHVAAVFRKLGVRNREELRDRFGADRPGAAG